ncbi:MAG: leucine-rich repeat domain-containing protein [Kiritimatiellia bacterium]
MKNLKMIGLIVACLTCPLFAETWMDSAGIIWTYTIHDGNKAEIVEPNRFAGRIVIPSRLGKCEVTRIGKRAFENCRGLESVTIPPRVTSIERDLFSGCTALTSVTIPSSVTHIGDTVFAHSGVVEVHFDGNAPNVRALYYDAPDNLTTYVARGSTGWIAPGIAGLPENGMWQGRRIAYRTSPTDRASGR